VDNFDVLLLAKLLLKILSGSEALRKQPGHRKHDDCKKDNQYWTCETEQKGPSPIVWTKYSLILSWALCQLEV